MLPLPILVLIFIASLLFLFTRQRRSVDHQNLQRFLLKDRPPRGRFNDETNENEEKLSDHTNEFEKEIILVGDRVHVAVGYGLANCVLIEGT